MITLDQAKALERGQILYQINPPYASYGRKRWKVTSVKTWKTRPNEVRIGLKYGLRSFDSINQNDLDLVSLEAK